MPRNRVLNRANVLTPTTRLNGVQRQRMLLFACLRSGEPDVRQVFPVDPWRWEWNPSRVLDGITRGARARIVQCTAVFKVTASPPMPTRIVDVPAAADGDHCPARSSGDATGARGAYTRRRRPLPTTRWQASGPPWTGARPDQPRDAQAG